jgi:hypothetical protein
MGRCIQHRLISSYIWAGQPSGVRIRLPAVRYSLMALAGTRLYGMRPNEKSSHRRMPKLHTSDLRLRFVPLSDSGAVHLILILVDNVLLLLLAERLVKNVTSSVYSDTAKPKSLILQTFRLSRSILLAHMSQWTIFSFCKYSRPIATSLRANKFLI